MKNFRRMLRTTKIEHTKIFLPQRNTVVYNDLQPAETKKFYHRIFSQVPRDYTDQDHFLKCSNRVHMC